MQAPTTANFELLSPLDAQLWYWDSPETPMCMGNVCLFEGEPLRDGSGNFRLEDVRRAIESRLHLVPRYRRKIMEVPGNLSHPALVDDPGFDIQNHVQLVTLPSPGSLDQLKEVFAKTHEGRLDRSRPLWLTVFVDGLEDGRVGMIQKIHHAPFDGATTVRIMQQLFDESREPGEAESAPAWEPQPPPSLPEVYAAAAAQQLAAAWKLAAGAPASLPMDPAQASELAETVGAMSAFGPAPPTSLNRPVGPRRRFDWVRSSLAEIKRIRGLVEGAKLNDVMLACVAGGLRALFLARGEDVAEIRPRVFVPVDARAPAELDQPGNKLSAMVIELDIAEPDPLKRLTAIAMEMAALKAGKQRSGMQLMMDMVSITPPMLLGAAAAQAGQGGFMNLTVTNVPGPPGELYLLGARMLELNPMLPIGSGLTVNVAVESYVDGLSVGICCDPEAVPDSDELTAGIAGSLDTLLGRADRLSG